MQAEKYEEREDRHAGWLAALAALLPGFSALRVIFGGWDCLLFDSIYFDSRPLPSVRTG